MLCDVESLTHILLGHDGQRSGLRRAWAVLRQCMPNPLSETEGKTIGSAHPGCPRRDWGPNHVSPITNTHAKLSGPIERCSNPRTVTEIERKVVKRGQRGPLSRFILSKGDKDKIAAWNQDLVRVLHIFNVRSIRSVGDLPTQQPPFRLSWQSVLT